MRQGRAVAVPNDAVRSYAEQLLTAPVTRGPGDCVLREPGVVSGGSRRGPNVLPADVEDITSASSSIHINQFGFRPGLVGDAFAEALIEKAADGIPVRLVVDRQAPILNAVRGRSTSGSRLPESRSASYARQAASPVGPGSGGTTRWNLSGLGHVDHRKVVIVDGRVGWVGGAGIEDYFQTAASTTCSYAPPGGLSQSAPLSRQLPLARGSVRATSSTVFSLLRRRAQTRFQR